MLSVRCLCLLLAMYFSVSLAQDGYETFPTMPGSRYKLYTLHHSWGEALTLCQGDGGGSHLVIINSQEEAEVVKEMLLRTSDKYVMVGINDIVQEGTWVTIQGGLVSTSGYNVWANGQPNEGLYEDCGCFNKDMLYWDISCEDYLLPFVCEKPEV